MVKSNDTFRFQQFDIQQDRCAMKVGTDGVLLGAWAPIENANSMLDIGAGTGLISLMLAQRQPGAKIIGIEIDELAAEQAKANVENSPFAHRVQIRHETIQSYSGGSVGQFDLIVSNPPFFTGGVLSHQQDRASVRHTVKLSHQDLLRSVQRLLKSGGRFCLVLPWLEGLRFRELAASYQLFTHQMVKVSPSPEKQANRVLLSLKKTQTAEVDVRDLAIYEHAGENAARSKAFAALTTNFYLNS